MRKPKIVVSKCLNSNKCRYDGQGYNDKVVSALKEHVDIINVCPEVGMGLSTPRKPIRLEKYDDGIKLVEYDSQIDYSSRMNEFTNNFFENLEDVDGFILKSKSPSCGMNDVKIYPKGSKCSISNKGSGIFFDRVKDKYSYLPIENEGRLKNYSIRDDFLTKIFTLNNLKESNELSFFHNDNKMLIKSYDECGYDELHSIIDKNDYEEYSKVLYNIFSNKRNKVKKLSIVEEMFNKYKNNLKDEEIKMFKSTLQSYNDGKIPFSALAIVLRMYAIRFDDKEMCSQTFFNPYPQELVTISDSGKRRDYRY